MLRLTCAAAGVVLSAAGALAGEVVLGSKDGSFQFEGNLLGIENNLYVLETSIGVVNVPMADVDCSGIGCPSSGAGSLSAALPEDKKLELFEAFAARQTAKGDRTPKADQFKQFEAFLEWRSKNSAQGSSQDFVAEQHRRQFEAFFKNLNPR